MATKNGMEQKTTKKRKAPSTPSVVYRLHETVLLADPKNNFKIWDEGEICELESYARQFKALEYTYKKHQAFRENWKNCIIAVDFFYNSIALDWACPNEDIPLKKAIVTGKAIHLRHILDAKNIAKLQKFKPLPATSEPVRTLLDQTKQEFSLGKSVRMTIPEYRGLLQLLRLQDDRDRRRVVYIGNKPLINILQMDSDLVTLVGAKRRVQDILGTTPEHGMGYSRHAKRQKTCNNQNDVKIFDVGIDKHKQTK